MKKWIISAVASVLLQANVVHADSSVNKSMHDGAVTIVAKQETALGEIKAYQFFNDAYAAYELARMETDARKRSQFYADAVKNVANITAAGADNGEAFLLASQIYRAKGGLTYAERYMKRADSVFYHATETTPQSIAANLDYALFCFATNLIDNPSQAKKAHAYAEKALKLIEAQRKMQKGESPKGYLRYEALANLIKGDIRACEKLLSDAADYDKRSREHADIGEEYYSSITYDRKHTTANIFYYSLFEDTVMQQKWLWPVAEKNVTKEFMLYYLTDLSRNEG